MKQNLIEFRERVMARANQALDRVWPERIGDDYVRETLWAIGELQDIAKKMQESNFNRIEQSRTYRLLGSLYADLEPALGKEMLLKAKNAYQQADSLLEGQSDEFERAKLNFNFGNTLRQIDPNDIEQLQEAKRRLLTARVYFAIHDPQFLMQVDAALQSVADLLKIAPLANAVKQNTDDMAILQKQLATGGDVREIAEKSAKIMKRGGGAAGMVGQLQTMINELSDEQKQSKKFTNIQKQMEDLTKQVLGNNAMPPEAEHIWSLLNKRLKSELDSDKISKERAESLSGALEEFGRILSSDEKDVHMLLAKLQRMKEFAEDKFEMAHYLSHGIERPLAGSRGAELVELNWQLRRYLLEEMNRPEKGEEESKEVLELNIRATRVDRNIYEAGSDNIRAMSVEKEDHRSLALAVRNFSARMYTMLARPIWHISNVPVDTNAVFYSGEANEEQSIIQICHHLGFEIMVEPRGESYANARWKQLQKAVTTLFDLRVSSTSAMAPVTYELGVALTLGKPVVILVTKDQAIPFDIDIDPVFLTDELSKDNIAISNAIDRSVIWTFPRPSSDASSKTLEYVLSLYPRPQQNTYVDQTIRMLTDFRNAHDPLAITRTLVKLFDYLKDSEAMLIHPFWPPVYPDANNHRLFHVMPFRPKWADSVKAVTRDACQDATVDYIRGDEVDEPNVIRSIWEEIAKATHVLVDLTDLNANVALELGIAHTLGKNVLMVCQGDLKDHIFQSISKFRVHSYNINSLEKTLYKEVKKFLLSK